MTIIDWLEFFNRKERYFLVKSALGGFSLHPSFRDELSFVLNMPIPPNTRIWMDYHFDWLYAALQLADDSISDESIPLKVFESPDFGSLPPPSTEGSPVHINTNQEDIDLLVAFMHDDGVHLVMIEAKGATSWGNKQFRSKVNRMRVIFDPEALWRKHYVIPHFVLASPKPPKFLKMEEWFPPWVIPDDGKPLWMPLAMPEDRRIVERWNDATGTPDKNSTTWHVRGWPPS